MAKKSKDVQATKAAKFVNRASRINLDGTSELHGNDVGVLRDQCFDRDGWKCVECGDIGWLQMDHIKSKGLHGRNDVIDNVQTLCVNCHAKKHVRVKLMPAKDRKAVT